MGYLRYTALALVAYSLVAPLMKVATREVPADVATVIANGVLVVGALAVVAFSDDAVAPYLTHELAPYMYAAGVCLTVGILAYYRALALGPVSVVTPLFGLFLVVSSAIGVFALDEPLTARKAAGVLLAIGAVYLTAGPGS